MEEFRISTSVELRFTVTAENESEAYQKARAIIQANYDACGINADLEQGVNGENGTDARIFPETAADSQMEIVN